MADEDLDSSELGEDVNRESLILDDEDRELHEDHPLLERAQKALTKQLSADKLRLEGELREKTKTLKVNFFP